jgi:hypothetical protein
MNTSAAKIERIVQRAGELRIDLIDAAGSVRPNNLGDDGRTTVQAALLNLRLMIDAFLDRDDPDNDITGEQSTE